MKILAKEQIEDKKYEFTDCGKKFIKMKITNLITLER